MTAKSLSLKILGVLCAVAIGNWAGCGNDDNPTAPPDATNHPPIISALTAEPDSFVMENSSLVTVTASDPDSDALSYTWELHGELQVVGANINTVRVMNCCPIFDTTMATVLSIVRDSHGEEVRDSINIWMLPQPKI